MTDQVTDTGTQAAESVDDGQQLPTSNDLQQQPEKKPEAEAEQVEKKPDTPKWFQKRIDQLTAQKKALEAELIATKQPQSKSDEPPDIDRLASQKAAEIVKAESFNKACNVVYEKGIAAHKDKFAPAVTTLRAVIGDEFPQFLEAVVDSDNAEVSAEMLIHFADHPDEAARFVDLNPRAQGREVAKLEAMFASKKAASASKAPAPVSTVSGAGRNSTGAVGTDDESEWYARREAELRKRR